MTETERRVTMGAYAFLVVSIIIFSLVTIFVLSGGKAFGAEIQRPVLVQSEHAFVLSDFPKGTTFACIEFASLDQPGYTPAKCLNFTAGSRTEFRADWGLVNCTIDDLLSRGQAATCADNKEWDVRGYTETGDENSRTYSNIVRVVYN